MVKGGPNHLIKSRDVQINQLEEDFEALTEVHKTGWSDFIRNVWSAILTTHASQDLDTRYSARQAAINNLHNKTWQLPPPAQWRSPLRQRAATASD